jgi:2-polyprenyl-6-methoxyphenol hydroxylase-like FAD-dependent oxidoreductase
MEIPTYTEVLVVGAGPLGMALATSLTDQGIGTLLVDKQAEMANTSRAAVVHARTLEVLDELNVTGELIDRGVVVPKFTVREHDRVLLHVEFDEIPSNYPYTLLVPQDITEQVLLKRLHDAGGRHAPAR